MKIKVFLPENLFYRKEKCEIFGEIAIEENALSYFIISDENETKLRHLGYVAPIGQRKLEDVSMNFYYDDETPNIYLSHLNIKPTSRTVVNLFLYDSSKVYQLNCEENAQSDRDFKDVYLLHQMVKGNRKQAGNRSKFAYLAWTLLNLLCAAFWKALAWVERSPAAAFLKHTTLFDHYLEWKQFKRERKQTSVFSLDKLAGIVVMVTLLFFINQPGEYLVQTSKLIINQLQLLLNSLKGSPIGLKLNVYLNNFFVDCFSYQIHLWATFLEIVAPVVRNLFIPIALLGVLGMSFQLAMLSDLIALVGLHAHCFYIYATVLYSIDKIGIQVLWKTVLGKRQNPLKNRVESHDYMNRQLYVATMFFTALLFLMPTILVYYVVFTTLRMCIYIATMTLKYLRRKLMLFPLDSLFKWIYGQYYCIECIEIEYLTTSSQTPLISSSVFKMNLKSSSFMKIFTHQRKGATNPKDFLPFTDVLLYIVQGKIFNLK